ncbi:MFS transporter [Nocardia spumae]|uniref:MFS transporter n=1 Tax=Nocardia spumae TaxID=2887190 RepID=UPI001D141BF4|nr:MFS transporter [Nocardia spumae]
MGERSAPARPRGMLVPLALAQFSCGFAVTSTAVLIADICDDLNTGVAGVQLVITMFLLITAAVTIPAGRLAERYGRKRCFTVGLSLYGAGAVVSALAPGVGVLVLGASVLAGVGAALLIPPVYILTALLFSENSSRAMAFGVLLTAGGAGAAAGPLLGGLIAFGPGWRAAFAFQALVIAAVLVCTRRMRDPIPADPARTLDVVGAVLSAGGLALLVLGILAADNDLRWSAVLIALAALVLTGFLVRVRATETAGGDPLISTSLFRSKVGNIGLATRLLQWLILMGAVFVVSAYLQVVRGHDPIGTGLIVTAATAGLLVSSLAAGRVGRGLPRRTLIMAGFGAVVVGAVTLIVLAGTTVPAWAIAPELLLIGLGVGSMLTPSVDVVQSAFGEDRQGEISGLSRCVSTLGSSLGIAIAGTVLVAGLSSHTYAFAMLTLAGAGALGLFASAELPSRTPLGQP